MFEGFSPSSSRATSEMEEGLDRLAIGDGRCSDGFVTITDNGMRKRSHSAAMSAQESHSPALDTLEPHGSKKQRIIGENTPNLVSLPFEILSLVAQYSAGSIHLAQTSRTLRLAVLRILWAEPLPLLAALPLPAAPPLLALVPDTATHSTADTDPLAAHLTRYGHFVRTLAFPDPSSLNLALVIPSLTNLVAVDFGGLEQFLVKDDHILLLLDTCLHLQDLALSDCVCVTDNALLALSHFDGAPMFRRLVLDRCCEMSDSGLVPLLEQTRNLMHLSLNLVPLATAAVTRTVALCCPKLESLALSDCDSLTDESLSWIAQGCVKIENLDLSECMGITEEGIMQFVSELKARRIDISHHGFTKLVLGSTPAITDRSLIALVTGDPSRSFSEVTLSPTTSSKRTLLQLDTLNLSAASNLTFRAMEALGYYISPHRLTTLNLNQTVFQDVTAIPAVTNALVELFKLQKNLESVHMSGGVCGAVEDAVLTSIAEHCNARLDTLDVSEAVNITDAGAHRVARECIQLSNANFKGCSNLTDLTVRSFVPETEAGTSKLRSLNMGLCNKITDASIELLASLCTLDPTGTSPSGLHTIKLSGCFDITDATLHHLASAIQRQHPPNQPHPASGSLRLLCFSGCYKITPLALQTLTYHLPFLESINLYSCPSMNNAAIAQLARACPRLLSLVVSKCPAGDVAAQAIARHCPRLHTLYLSFLSVPPAAGAHLTDMGVRALLEGCRGLKLLDLSRCDALSDEAFEGAGVLGLQVLIVRACPRLTFDGMAAFAARCRRMLTLDVIGCAGIGAGEREQLREIVEGRG
ncbi:hypothetical protein BC830DRAFT_1152780 [Chytriomyces sp. MP71]|nr:hypothetical protein BC830DRAFT_1152780 [Chytriomyces sp. MP71]